jgi:uncharacterized protein
MPNLLNEIEARVLASLVEKQITTPEYYPMTLNALTAACNQKTNREPVVAYDEATVSRAVESLREKNLAYVFYGSTSRVPKYKNMIREVLELSEPETALISVLMLRGAQTVGELKERAGRLFSFSSLGEVDETLNNLILREPEPLVVKLPRQPGQKEARYVHLLSGEPDISNFINESEQQPALAPRADRLTKLEEQVEALNAEMQSLRQMFEEFKRQFE